ncbi:hypothetical protein PoB_005401900 [Plakobranchus ocellatus]|uniref:Uncharacterized protein n=1 Tax=Plakobranchus ocellatus TaxID=259542 RepID=A0AAV4C4P2_9GAST|nr:hypothetical protein PoB_005401900 [Plakobranchus ocellatus]
MTSYCGQLPTFASAALRYEIETTSSSALLELQSIRPVGTCSPIKTELGGSFQPKKVQIWAIRMISDAFALERLGIRDEVFYFDRIEAAAAAAAADDDDDDGDDDDDDDNDDDDDDDDE